MPDVDLSEFDQKPQPEHGEMVVARVSLPPPAGEDLVHIDLVKVRREWLRIIISVGLLVLLGLVALIPLVALVIRGAPSSEIETLMTLIFPSLIGVFGTVTGFYFGGEH